MADTMLAAAFRIAVWIALDARFVSDSVCTVVFAKFTHARPGFLVYAWFYWIGWFGMVARSPLGIAPSWPERNRPLEALCLGTIGFITPSLDRHTVRSCHAGALSSIM